MALKTDAVGKEWPATTYQVGREKIKEYANALGIGNPVHHDVDAARAAGFRDVVAPPMFAVVYSSPALAPAILDPEVEMNFAAMVHGGQEFAWDEPACSGRRDHDRHHVPLDRGEGRQGFLRVRDQQRQPRRRPGRSRHLDADRQGGLRWL